MTGWRTEGGRIAAALTAQGDITADEYVLAGGSWSPQIVRGLGLRLPMQAGKGYSVTLPQPRQMPQLCSIFTEARVAVTPWAQRCASAARWRSRAWICRSIGGAWTAS